MILPEEIPGRRTEGEEESGRRSKAKEKSGGRAEARELELEVLCRVREIPAGFVRTYGDVSPGAPRFAGSVLFASDQPDLPWWRVVRADGSLAKGAEQRRRLIAEGVPFRGERVDMESARLP